MIISILLKDNREDGLLLPHTQGVLFVLRAATVCSGMKGAQTGLSKPWDVYLNLLEECELGRRDVTDVNLGWRG